MSDSLAFLTSDNLTHFIIENQYSVLLTVPFVVGDFFFYFIGVSIGSGNTLNPFILIFLPVMAVTVDTIIVSIVWFIQKRCSSLDAQIGRITNSFKPIQNLDKILRSYEKKYESFDLFLLFTVKLLPFSKIILVLFALRHRMNIFRFILRDSIAVLFLGAASFIFGFLVSSDALFSYDGGRVFHTIVAFLIFIVITVVFGKYLERLFHHAMKKIVCIFSPKTNVCAEEEEEENGTTPKESEMKTDEHPEHHRKPETPETDPQ